MTIQLRKFGKNLVTREDAKLVLQAIGVFGDMPTFDFSGVAVANHPFADELGKGLVACFSGADLSKIKLTGANPYVKNCVEAGFSTAADKQEELSLP